jgi:hypothetical protein
MSARAARALAADRRKRIADGVTATPATVNANGRPKKTPGTVTNTANAVFREYEAVTATTTNTTMAEVLTEAARLHRTAKKAKLKYLDFVNRACRCEKKMLRIKISSLKNGVIEVAAFTNKKNAQPLVSTNGAGSSTRAFKGARRVIDVIHALAAKVAVMGKELAQWNSLPIVQATAVAPKGRRVS